MPIAFVDEDKEARVIKCIVLTKPIVDGIKTIVARYPGANQSSVICKILTAYLTAHGEM